ncbi:AAA family ATPase [Streptacidiphilus anmyonensis]|uniref:AAA family ATPase n=1 Tax=Streptacidiphilus anmyonensis TaxID=405782 RepID=UPI00128D1A45|nr:AAA family ATPase [Streptacidiphilus anmyonensis]
MLVNGLSGSGKTTLARALARHLKLPLLSKNVINEARADVLGTAPAGWVRRRWNAAIGAAASETMCALLAYAPGGAVLESCWPADFRDFVPKGLNRPNDPATGRSGATSRWRPPDSGVRPGTPAISIHAGLPTDDEWDRCRPAIEITTPSAA